MFVLAYPEIFQRCSRNILTPCISAIQLAYAFCGDISRVKWRGKNKEIKKKKKKRGEKERRKLDLAATVTSLVYHI